MEKLEENILKSGANIYLLYSFLKRLVMKFEEWPAYEMGLIDKDGKVLKQRRDMSKEERQNFSKFDVLILNLKKLLSKLPGGSTRLASFGAALFLLKEGKDMSEEEIDSIMYKLPTILEEYTNKVALLMEEDGGVPANTSSGGHLARKTDKNTALFKILKRKKKKSD